MNEWFFLIFNLCCCLISIFAVLVDLIICRKLEKELKEFVVEVTKLGEKL